RWLRWHRDRTRCRCRSRRNGGRGAGSFENDHELRVVTGRLSRIEIQPVPGLWDERKADQTVSGEQWCDVVFDPVPGWNRFLIVGWLCCIRTILPGNRIFRPDRIFDQPDWRGIAGFVDHP